MTIPDTALATHCTHWCGDHDHDGGRCVSPYRFLPLSLETPVEQFGELRPRQMNLCLETSPDGDPWVVMFRGDDTGTTMTPQEAARLAIELWSIAAQGQAGKVAGR